jgi:hypothetical protein
MWLPVDMLHQDPNTAIFYISNILIKMVSQNCSVFICTLINLNKQLLQAFLQIIFKLQINDYLVLCEIPFAHLIQAVVCNVLICCAQTVNKRNPAMKLWEPPTVEIIHCQATAS